LSFRGERQRLEDENIKSLLDYSRKELQFEVINDKGNKRNQLDLLVNELANRDSFIESEDKAGIVFTPNVNGEFGCYSISNFLNTKYPEKK
jgi:ATP-dependent DNA helicase RecQ